MNNPELYQLMKNERTASTGTPGNLAASNEKTVTFSTPQEEENYYKRQDTIKTFMPQKYQGKWYEIARLPLIWEKNCVYATADYQWDAEHNIMHITNTCYTITGNQQMSTYQRKGIAFTPNRDDPGKLLVQFTDGGPADLIPGDYYIHYTDYNNISIVGSKSGENLWVLSRQPKIRSTSINRIIRDIKNFGYEPDNEERSLTTNRDLIIFK